MADALHTPASADVHPIPKGTAPGEVPPIVDLLHPSREKKEGWTREDLVKAAAMEFDCSPGDPEAFRTAMRHLLEEKDTLKLAWGLLAVPKADLVSKLKDAVDSGSIKLFTDLMHDLNTYDECLTGFQHVASGAHSRLFVAFCALRLDPLYTDADIGLTEEMVA